MSQIGKLSYEYFFKPIGKLKKFQERGYYSNKDVIMAQTEMKVASNSLEVCFNPSVDSVHLYFLTGKNHWHQTIFCLKSLEKVGFINTNIFILDDGTIDTSLTNLIVNSCKGISIITNENFLDVFSDKLGPEKFPTLYNSMKEYPMFRKLYYRCMNEKYSVSIDSDILFYHNPSHFQDNFEKKVSFSIKDKYPFCDFNFDTTSSITKLNTILFVNAGIAGMQNSYIDWYELEYWAKKLSELYGGYSFFLEQTLTSMLFSKCSNFSFLPPDLYLIEPTRKQVLNKTGICHHYVGSNRDNYYLEGWKKFI